MFTLNWRWNWKSIILDANVPFFIEFLTESTVTLVNFSHPIITTAQTIRIAFEADFNTGQSVNIEIATLKFDVFKSVENRDIP